MTQGFCIPCIRNEDDIETHKHDFHKGKKPLENELYSGSIFCKKCRNLVLTPRGKKWEEAPLHKAFPAIPIKEPSTGLILRYVNESGMNLATQALTITPELEAVTEGKTGCVALTE